MRVDALGRMHRPYDGVPRIVSLVPSLTELICDLGLADCLVGRTGFCVHPREALRHVPKVGGTKDVKLDAVRTLAPTHLIADIDENRRDAVEAMAEFVPQVVVVHPQTVDDNLALYALLGGIFRRDAEAARLTAEFAAARQELVALAATLPREAVLYPIWREPWMTVRRDTYIAAMLSAAGWDTLPAEATTRFPEFTWDAPWLAGISRVLLPSEPYAFTDRHLAEVGALAQRPVTRIDGEMVSWYGSRAIAGLRYLAELRRQLS
ncbi:MAG: iron hydroxamate ABC transporter periplasmic protein [Rhodocyclaceae bacterium]|nr:MAG: iron hydroxamate ABC transporter periplasmic protein [Rhodocyclaceae bacterium]TND06057.1 MAG: iron hydroxamate ABC transporter periplasmic protein [Rhodocyclaceae bacterium]